MRYANDSAHRATLTPTEQRKLARESLLQAHRIVFKYKGYRRATDYINSQLVFISKRHAKDIYKFLEVVETYKELNENDGLF